MPITIRNVYDNAVSFEKLLKSHKKARRGKREKKEIILFELNLEKELAVNFIILCYNADR